MPFPNNMGNLIHRLRHNTQNNMKTIQIPPNTRNGVSIVFSSRACRSDGQLFSDGEKVTSSNLHSRVCMTVRSLDESSVHRVSALALFQGGGEAHFYRSQYDHLGRLSPSPLYLGVVLFPVGAEVSL